MQTSIRSSLMSQYPRKKKTATSRVSKGISPPAPLGTVREPLDSYGSSRCVFQLASGRHTNGIALLTSCLLNTLIVPCGCLVFNNFYILCTPSLRPTFEGHQRYYGYIRPCTSL